jgi:hypothetical protein
LIYRPGQTIDLPSPNKRALWVLSRRATRQSVFTFPSDVADNKKKALLRVQVRRWAPFPNAKYLAQWSGNKASVYAWNDDEVKAAIIEAGFNERRCTVCPESFIRAPSENGARLVTAIDGFEAQVWRDGFLAFSRWWSQRPTQIEWDMFLRSAAVPLNQGGLSIPEPVSVEVLEAPWINQQGYLNNAWALLEDPRYAAAIATLVAAPFIYFGVEYTTLAIANARVKSDLEKLSVETQGIRKQRTTALSNLDEIEDYMSLEVYPNQFTVLTTALGLLQGLNVKIPEWTYDVGTLSFTLRAERDIDATLLITAFEKSGAFTNVTASRVGQEGQLRVRMDVLPKQTNIAGR